MIVALILTTIAAVIALFALKNKDYGWALVFALIAAYYAIVGIGKLH